MIHNCPNGVFASVLDIMVFLLKMGHSRPLLFYFRLFNTIYLTVNKCSVKICRCLDSNRVPLELEATVLSTEPRPLPQIYVSYNQLLN